MTQQPNGPCPFGAERQHEWMTRADNGVVECNLCQAAANVRLFAARSDLLAALELAVRYLEHPDVLAVTQHMALPGSVAVDRARSAIAKAQGG